MSKAWEQGQDAGKEETAHDRECILRSLAFSSRLMATSGKTMGISQALGS